MRSAIVSIDALRQRDQWKAEFFLTVESSPSDSAFPLRRVGDIAVERKETIDPQAFADHLFAYVGLEHVESLTGDLLDCQPTLGAAIKSRSKVFRQGDVLYGRLRPYLNKVLAAESSIGDGICSGEFLVLAPRKDVVVPLFLRFLLASSWVHGVVSRLQAGSTHPRLSIDDLLEMQVPVPPLADQIAVVELLRQADGVRRELKRRVALLPMSISDRFVSYLRLGELPNEELVLNQGGTLADLALPPTYKSREPKLPI
ncbi:MAG TPA: restriction endonuclease subunit S [Burkholderiaceae bacterium]|nr:restriction endonuclease subunit S [Burkholderiaceae bacterium]